jgi:hypothetical protein
MMPRVKKSYDAVSESTQEAITELARDILTYGHMHSDFWNQLSEALLIKVLPAGVEAALERIRAMKMSPERYSSELLGLEDTFIHRMVLLRVEDALSAHITRLKSVIPPQALKEMYRRSGERQAERQSARICPTCRRPFW